MDYGWGKMTSGTQGDERKFGRKRQVGDKMDRMWPGERPDGRNRTGRVGAGRCSVCGG